MADENLNSFQQRLSRIDGIHAEGGAFEATGMLGRRYFATAPVRRGRGGWLRAAGLVLAAVLVFKSGLLAYLGAGVYGERVAQLQRGGPVDQLGAWVLVADPVTVRLASYGAEILRPLRQP
ncbi:hypothetical protein [Phaeovulum sp. W22_SRMD_FR3]|uniref:hypothetical protein n=1 Tax=Phaeovulum sp. W22_SRMD_FR3 TaxID=3240274 RepID=UPI003F98B2E2